MMGIKWRIIYSLLVMTIAITFSPFQVSARYSRDPYNMLDQLKKMNLKHVKVAYGIKNDTKGKNDTSSKKS